MLNKYAGCDGCYVFHGSMTGSERFLLRYPSTIGIVIHMKCPIHKIELICYCPACRGEVTSKRKAATSRDNGKLGGRPKGSKNKPKSEPKGK